MKNIIKKILKEDLDSDELNWVREIDPKENFITGNRGGDDYTVFIFTGDISNKTKRRLGVRFTLKNKKHVSNRNLSFNKYNPRRYSRCIRFC